MGNIPSKPVVVNQEWTNGVTKLNQTNLTSGVNQNITNIKTAVDGIIDALGGPGADPKNFEEITWTALKALRDAGQLVPGKQYRITDYECTTVTENTSSAGHPFDIIVTADDDHTLNENARAILHEGDTDYFGYQVQQIVSAEWLDGVTINDIEFKAFLTEGLEVKYVDDEMHETAQIITQLTKLVNQDGIEVPAMLNPDPDDSGNECYYVYVGTFKLEDITYDVWQEYYPNEDKGYTNDYHLTNILVSAELETTVKERSKVSAWQLKYSLDNDTSRFAWADATDGKGVIYYMKDEFNNECPYDFKNILFTASEKYTNAYTFTYTNGSALYDASILANKECYNNVIKEFYSSKILQLNWNVFYSITNSFSCYSNTFGAGCHSNTFDYNCYSNTFGADCYSNTFGYGCYSNQFGADCYSNTFGYGCYSNQFDIACYKNTFGDTCHSNTFGDKCSSNTFGFSCFSNQFDTGCYSNQFGINCDDNTFGSYCSSNTFGDSCFSNIFGDHCEHNTFGDSCYSNTFGYRCYYNQFDTYCHYNTFVNYCFNNTFGRDSNNNTFGINCSFNTFGGNSSSNTFGDNCSSNTFGNRFSNNTIGFSFQHNTFGDSCSSNTFGDSCSSNTFGDSCSSNTFGNTCRSSTFGDNCSDNTFGDNFFFVTFGDGCYSNTFGNNCQYNIFGNRCRFVTFGINCSFITFGTSSSAAIDYCKNIIVDNGCSYINLTSDDTDDKCLQNIHLHLSVIGASSSNRLVISVPRNLPYETEYYLDNLGNLTVSNFSTRITWSELKTLRDSGKLVPGKQYRITDYVTTTAKEDTRSAGHQFDVIVKALSADKLSEEAYAILHEGDTYFANSNLNAWKLWYSIDNDTNRFDWADATNGKGVIYYMKDEFNNECPYDFKNIVNIRWKTKVVTQSNINDLDIINLEQYFGPDYYDVSNLMARAKAQYKLIRNMSRNNIQNVPAYLYTRGVTGAYERVGDLDETLHNFLTNGENYSLSDDDYIVAICYDDNEGVATCYMVVDTSREYELYTFGNGTINSSGAISNIVDSSLRLNNENVYGNSIGVTYNGTTLTLSGNVFIGNNCNSNTFGDDCYSNTFGDDCYSNIFSKNCHFNTFSNNCNSNTFSKNCYSNIFGDDCYSNIFGDYCYFNTFGNNCNSNTFGDNCNSNIFGNSCNSNIFGNYCYSNTFSNDCNYNTFSNYCNSNIFGNNCYSNIFGDYCKYNTFINNCNSNTFGDDCYSNTFGDNCNFNRIGDEVNNQFEGYASWNIFENGVSYVALESDGSTPAFNNILQNVTIHQGVKGASSSNMRTIAIDRNLAYSTDYYANGSKYIILD